MIPLGGVWIVHSRENPGCNPVEGGSIPSQSTMDKNLSSHWFWTDEWQAGEKEVDAYIQAGEYEEFDTLEELFDSLAENKIQDSALLGAEK